MDFLGGCPGFHQAPGVAGLRMLPDGTPSRLSLGNTAAVKPEVRIRRFCLPRLPVSVSIPEVSVKG